MANSDKQIRQQLFEWLETGDRPTEAQFQDIMYSMIIQLDDEVWIEDDAPEYDNYMGIGTTSPVGRLSLSGSAVIGSSWAGDRGINANLIPEDGMLIEGGVKIGTFGDPSDPDKYKVHIKSENSGVACKTLGQRPLNINSAEHKIMVFTDTEGAETDPYTFIEEGNHGFRFYSWTDTVQQETVEITYDGRVRINVPNAPEARVDVEAGSLPGLRMITTNNDQIVFDGASTVPHTFLDQSSRGFRFYKEGVGERMRIADDGNVGINETNPQYKTQVGGDVALNPGGNMYGIRVTEPLKFHANSTETDGSVMEMHPHTVVGSNAISNGKFDFKSHGPDVESGFYFKQSAPNAPDNYPMLIQGDGKIGVNLGLDGSGTDPVRPERIMHIKGNGKDTGMRLQTGAEEGHILISDNVGNATWRGMNTLSKSGTVPREAIVMWHNVNNIPDGYALCDGGTYPRSDGSGQVTTPDLKSRFVVGYHSGHASNDPLLYGKTGNTGGKTEHQLTGWETGVVGHSHDVTITGHTVGGGEHTHQTKVMLVMLQFRQ
jgi:hypothetical protein